MNCLEIKQFHLEWSLKILLFCKLGKSANKQLAIANVRQSSNETGHSFFFKSND